MDQSHGTPVEIYISYKTCLEFFQQVFEALCECKTGPHPRASIDQCFHVVSSTIQMGLIMIEAYKR